MCVQQVGRTLGKLIIVHKKLRDMLVIAPLVH